MFVPGPIDWAVISDSSRRFFLPPEGCCAPSVSASLELALRASASSSIKENLSTPGSPSPPTTVRGSRYPPREQIGPKLDTDSEESSEGGAMADYAKDVLVETDWVAEHLDDDSTRIVEVDENPALYAEAHIPGAIGFDWKTELQDQVKRDFLGPDEFGALFGGRGVSNDHTVVLYGDRNNWFAAYTYWYLRYYGHDNVKLMNGPREKWISEGRQTTSDVPSYPAATF